jgi:hypothetical protein
MGATGNIGTFSSVFIGEAKGECVELNNFEE